MWSLIHWTPLAALVAAIALIMVACGGGNGDPTLQPQNAQVTVEEVINTVETDRRRDTDATEADFRAAQIGQGLITGDGVKTFSDSEARIDIAIVDHLRIARTKPNTLWRLGQFSVDENTVIELDQGKIFVFDDGFPEGRPTIDVVTPAGTASARGTWISVGYSPETGEAEVQCFRGLCELANQLGSVLLTDQQKSTVTVQREPTKPEPMDEDDIQQFTQLPEARSGEVAIPPPVATPALRTTLTPTPSPEPSPSPASLPLPTPTPAPTLAPTFTAIPTSPPTLGPTATPTPGVKPSPIQPAYNMRTGKDLQNDPKTKFPSPRVRTVAGTSLGFGTGSSTNEKLLVYPLDSPVGDVVGTIGVNWTRGAGDNDAYLGLTDGTNHVAIEYGDNSGGTYWWNEGTIDTKSTFSRIFAPPVATGVGYNLTPDSHTLEIDYRVCSSGEVVMTEVRNSFGSAVGPFAPIGGTTLNTDAGLSLFVGQHNAGETQTVNYVIFADTPQTDIDGDGQIDACERE